MDWTWGGTSCFIFDKGGISLRGEAFPPSCDGVDWIEEELLKGRA